MNSNEEKNKWQEEAIIKWLNNKGLGLIRSVTASGKSFVAIKIIQRMLSSSKYDKLRVILVVPSTDLETKWKEDFDKFDLDVQVFVINSVALKEVQYECDLVVFDEVHKYTGIKFKTVFEKIKYKYLLALTSTIFEEAKYEYILKYCPIVYNLPINIAIERGIICDIMIYNLMLPLSNNELNFLIEAKEQYDSHITIFTDYTEVTKCLHKQTGCSYRMLIAKREGLDEKQVLGKAIGVNNVVLKRKEMLYKAKSKLDTTVEIIERFKDKKIITFNQLQEVSDNLGILTSSMVIHSKMSKKLIKKVFDAFKSNEIRILHSVKKLNTGVDVPDADLGIIVNFTSSKEELEQIIGRFLRLAENKEKAIVINLCFKSDRIVTQDLKWLNDGLKNLRSKIPNKIKTIKSIDEII